ncbi:MAG: PorV/PorQ family protein [Caldithrix sp.]|nr:PorV/PorQ family protein [Caldithrix sp.]
MNEYRIKMKSEALMKKQVIIAVMAVFLLNTYPAFSQDLTSSTISKVGTTVGQFLKFGASARSIAMGGAFTSVANDVSAIYWNPAGLATIRGNEVMFTHTQWIADTQYDFGAISLNLGAFGTLGAMISSFSSGDMKVRTVEQPDGTGELFNTQDIMAGLTYSRSLTDKFALGFSVKYINQRIWHMSASTIAIDVGTLFTTPLWGIRLGSSLTNYGPKMRLRGRDAKFAYDPDPDNQGNVEIVNSEYEMLNYSLPLRFQVGVAKDVLNNEANRLTIAADAVHPNDNYEAVNAGFEYGFREMVFLRGGYKSLFQKDSEEGLTLGAGAHLRLAGATQIRIDYAYVDFGRLDNTQKFSLSMHF